ncbi:MAG: bacteriohemerythrin [Elusimicrobiaceae bacterium]
MPLEWTASLATGFDDIDGQHKELIEKASAFAHAVAKNQDLADLDQLLDFLDAYAAEHFAYEEGILTARNYPNLAAHMAQHAYFKRNLTEIRRAYQRDGCSEEIVARVYSHVTGWLVAHIKKTDGEWAAYLKNLK